MGQRLDATLVAEIVGAIDDQDRWKRVLRTILDRTGARAAIITLRENRTCQIVDDMQLQALHHSPFVEGFELERVGYYIYNLRQKDIWADAQIDRRPLLPTRMSTMVKSDIFAGTELGQWCREQEIDDTIVVQIGQTPGFWTALNVFFDSQVKGCAERTLDLLNTHLTLLRSAWKTGRDMVRTRETGNSLLSFLSEQGIAAGLLDSSGAVTATNDEFRALRDLGVVMVSAPSNRISLADGVDRGGMAPDFSGHIRGHEAAHGHRAYRASLRPITVDPLYEGIREPEYLLLLEPVEAEDITFQRKLAPGLTLLTPQERGLYDAICLGHSVPEAGEQIGVRRTRAFEIWGHVKEKLGVKTASQLRLRGRS